MERTKFRVGGLQIGLLRFFTGLALMSASRPIHLSIVYHLPTPLMQTLASL